MAIWLPERDVWTQQPQGVARINWTNPITRGLVKAFAPLVERDAVDGSALVQGVGHGYVQGDRLIGASGGSAGATYGSIQTNGLTKFSLIAIVTPNASVTRAAIWCHNTGAGGPSFGASFSDATQLFGYTSGTSEYWNAGTGILTVGQRVCVGWTMDGSRSGRHRVFKDGRFIASTNGTAGATSLVSDDTHPFRPGGPHTGSSISAWRGSVEGIFCWNRTLTDTEVWIVSRNPWQIFE